MSVKVKLLDSSLIRTFGGVFVVMNDSQAKRYIDKGSAKLVEQISIDNPFNLDQSSSVDKTVWKQPEDKLFESSKVEVSNKIYPGPDDKLFTQIK